MRKSTISRLAATGVAAVLLGAGAGVTNAANATSGSLDARERATLVRMVEEEKLAHDVYVTLGKVWGVRVFSNISASETRHTEAVRSLLSTYGIADPTKGKAIGEFSDPTFAKLYAQLVASGKASVAAALQAGVTIESLDIDDLRERIPQTDEADVKLVLSSLLRGSQNHLAAFSR